MYGLEGPTVQVVVSPLQVSVVLTVQLPLGIELLNVPGVTDREVPSAQTQGTLAAVLPPT